MFNRLISIVLLSVSMLAGCGGGSHSAPEDASLSSSMHAMTATNTVSFPGNRSTYKVIKLGTGYAVAGPDGVVTQYGSVIENLRFSDVTVTLSIGSKAASIKESDLRLLMELYVAFFNRVPDAEGLTYWINQFQAGQNIHQIADSFHSIGVQLTSLTGYSPVMTHADFVRVVYKNVLGRSGETAPPNEDVEFWAAELGSGRQSKGLLVKTMLDSAHTFKGDASWGWVADLLDNKVKVARTFAVGQGLNYNSVEDSIKNTMAIADAVTPTSANLTGFPVDTSMVLGPVPPPPAGIWAPSPGATPSSGSYIYLESTSGDYIGLGKSYTYTKANANISVTANNGRLSVGINGDEYWNGNFQAMNSLPELKLGYYGDLQRYPFHNPVKGGLDWSGEGRGCNVLKGWFAVDEIIYAGNNIEAIDLRFEQRCEGGTTALRGKIHWTAKDTTSAPGPVWPIPSGLWTPPTGGTPAFDNYVFLESTAADYIGQGGSYTYTPADAIISVTSSGGRLSVRINGDETWTGDFQTMDTLAEMKPGYYGGLERYPFHNPVKGGLSWSGEGRGCNTLKGWYAIDHITYTSGKLTAIDLRFEQQCEGGTSALRGKLHWSHYP